MDSGPFLQTLCATPKLHLPPEVQGEQDLVLDKVMSLRPILHNPIMLGALRHWKRKLPSFPMRHSFYF